MDELGAELWFYVTPVSNMNCRQTYRVGWSFNPGIAKLTEGQTINIEVYNKQGPAIQEGLMECFRQASIEAGDTHPLTINFKGCVQSELLQKPEYSFYWSEQSPYLFDMEGQEEYRVLEGQEAVNGSFIVKDGQEEEGTANAPFGSLSVIIGKEGVFSFEVLYLLYGEESEISPAGAHRLRFENPVIEHNVPDERGELKMNVVVPGLIDDAVGRKLKIVSRFIDYRGRPMPAYSGDTLYCDQHGNAFAFSYNDRVPEKSYDLMNMNIMVPYYALNLPRTETVGHLIYVFAEIYLDGEIIGVSRPVQTVVVW